MQPHTILLIDDHEDFRMVLKYELGLEGYKVIQAEDGYDGLAQMATGTVPSLIITDVNMPNLDGLQFLKLIRKQPRFKDVPVLICTADDRFKDLPIDLGYVRSTGKEIYRIVALVQGTKWASCA